MAMSLVAHYEDVLKTIVRLRSGELPCARSELKESIWQELKTADSTVIQECPDCSKGQRENVQFAIAAFADESAMSRDGEMKAEWKNGILRDIEDSKGKTLVHAVFKMTDAGHEFFRRLRRVRLDAPLSSEALDVLEIYCLCLLLGYKGEGGDLKTATSESVAQLKAQRHSLQRETHLGRENLEQSVASLPDRAVRVLHRFALSASCLFVGAYFIFLVTLLLHSRDIIKLLAANSSAQ